MIIIKVGGGKELNLDEILVDFAGIKEKKILVHGANYEAKQLSEKLGNPPKMVTSVSGHVSRRTDRTTLEILEMAYSGLVNKRIVEKLQALGINAVGLTGMDGRIWEGERKPFIKIRDNGKSRIIRDDYTGKVEKINTELLTLLLDNNYVPVLTIPGISYENEAINLDNDRAIAVMGGALKAEKIIILIEEPGVLRDIDDKSSVVQKIRKEEIDSYIKLTEARMRKKMLGVKEALDSGVKQIHIADGRICKPITAALHGGGTLIR
ncbi:[LysW]-aminoadipate kinase [Candidatus Woesearchaeota archaeon]|nr:[LysW]-aminoadipate kinase [Candidatus Woesearchaeota archaeon]